MRISIKANQCESDGVNPPLVTAIRPVAAATVQNSALRPVAGASRVKAKLQTGLLALLAITGVFTTVAETTNSPATSALPSRVASAPQKLDEAAFRIIAERNIFNAERIGAVRIASSRRPARVESFKLVGTMAYAKGAFAFFEGSSSELTKVLKPDGVIAGYKLVDILTDAVKLEADGKILELSIGLAMRREDEGTWRPGEAAASSATSSFASTRENSDSNRSSRSRDIDSSRSRRGESDSEPARPAAAASSSPASTADPAEILKRLMERRERESQ
jgi:hypothetical protein